MKQTVMQLTLCWLSYSGLAQEAKTERLEDKKESREQSKEKHKQFWKKIGNDQRNFWKSEHEKHINRQEERKVKKEHEKEEVKDSPESREKKSTIKRKQPE